VETEDVSPAGMMSMAWLEDFNTSLFFIFTE